MEGADTLSIKSQDLGEALSNHHFKSTRHKMAYRCTVLIKIAGCEARIGYVEEWEMSLSLTHVCNLVPLLHARIDTCGVVCTRLHQNYRPIVSHLKCLNHSFEV